MSIYKILVAFVSAVIFLGSCAKDTADTKLDPKLSTSQVLSISSDSATVVGFVVAEGDGFTEKGVCYSTEKNPTIASSKVAYTGKATTASFNVVLSKLAYVTKYYVKAYATGVSGTIYGEEYSFTTLAHIPFVETTAMSAVTGNSAKSGGNVTATGGADVTARGICYSTKENPTIADAKTSDGNGTGTFASTISNIKGKTTYYLRAYAVNSAGVAYGAQVSFTTEIDVPTVKTLAANNIKASEASSGGVISYNGGSAITERGICWGTSSNPTITDNIVKSTAVDSFACNITGLALATTYHVRAYAKNSAGVAYGEDIQFATYPSALYMIGDGVGGWDWANVDLPMIPVNSHPNLFWKIVWLNASGGFKFAPVKDWKGDFGKTGDATAGVFNKGGDNIPVPGVAGYYMVVVDFATNKIAIADPKVYLIGNTIGSWDGTNAAGLFNVDNTNGVVSINKTLAADELRMYAWHPWFTDWWQSEFIILNGKIAFRGTGGDQDRVSVAAGSTSIKLNFKTGAGSIAAAKKKK